MAYVDDVDHSLTSAVDPCNEGKNRSLLSIAIPEEKH